LLAHVVAAARNLDPGRIAVVYGHGGDLVPKAFDDPDLLWVEQDRQLGTGHAVQLALPAMDGMELLLVLYGDVPLIRTETLERLVEAARVSSVGLLTAKVDDPTGYGRVVRGSDGALQRIVEQRDASSTELTLSEINTGILAADADRMRVWVSRLESDNAQGEYYLTDVLEMAVGDGLSVETIEPNSLEEIAGINDRLQLSRVERHLQRRQAESLMLSGVTIMDPSRFDLRGELTCGIDVEIDVNVVFEGCVVLGDGVRIGANTVIRDCEIGSGTLVLENCVIEDAQIGENCRIGPFSRIRPDTVLADEVHVGNFVEIKKSGVGRGSKINHLSYVGDATVGASVNIGAGTITCNYDGAFKHRTVIEDGVFIGSDSQLVAPVRIGEGATIGAGSTITEDAPGEQLTLSRSPQVSISGWIRPRKPIDKGRV